MSAMTWAVLASPGEKWIYMHFLAIFQASPFRHLFLYTL